MLNNLFWWWLRLLIILHQYRWVVFLSESCGCRTYFWDFLFLFLWRLFKILVLLRSIFFGFIFSRFLGLWVIVGVNFVLILTLLTTILVSFYRNIFIRFFFLDNLFFSFLLIFTITVRLFQCTFSNWLFHYWFEINIRYQIWKFFNSFFCFYCFLFYYWLFFTLKVILYPLGEVVCTMIFDYRKHSKVIDWHMLSWGTAIILSFYAEKVDFLHATEMHTLVSDIFGFLGVKATTLQLGTTEPALTGRASEILNYRPNSPENLFTRYLFLLGE